MSKVKIENNCSLFRSGDGMMSFIQNHCDLCNWVGSEHYAHNDSQHTNCQEERADHNRKCNGLGEE